MKYVFAISHSFHLHLFNTLINIVFRIVSVIDFIDNYKFLQKNTKFYF